MAEDLRGQKMDEKSPGGLDKEEKSRGAELQEQEAQGPGPIEGNILRKELGCKAP
jgi:hypothetical protein